MNIESSHAESKDTQEEGCQDPEETMFRPPLNISILFYLSEQVKTGIVCSFFLQVTSCITCPTHSV